MKRLIYILILISTLALNLEVKAEWIEHYSFKNTSFIDTTYGKIVDYKIVEEKTIWAVTENNQILSYDLETGNLISNCQCEFDTIPSFKEVSSDGKTTSFAFFDGYRENDFKIVIIENQNCNKIDFISQNTFDFLELEQYRYENLHTQFGYSVYFNRLDYFEENIFLSINHDQNDANPIITGKIGIYSLTNNKLKLVRELERNYKNSKVNNYFFNSKNNIIHSSLNKGEFYFSQRINNEYNIFSNNLETKTQIRNIDRNNIVNLVNDSTILLYNYGFDSIDKKPIFRFINYNINTKVFDTLKITRIDYFEQYNKSWNSFKFISQATFFIDEYNNLFFEGGIINLNVSDSLLFNKNYGCYNYYKHQNISTMKKYELRKLNGYYTYFYIDNDGILNKLKTIEIRKMLDYGFLISKNIVKINEEIEFTSILQKQGFIYSWEVEPNVIIETKEPKLKYTFKNTLNDFNVKLSIKDSLGKLVYSTNNNYVSLFNCGDNFESKNTITVVDNLDGNFDVVNDKNYPQTYYIRNKSIGSNQSTYISISEEKGMYLVQYKPFKDNISYNFEKDGVYRISFYVTNGIEHQSLERIVIVNTNKKINVFNPKLFYLDKDVSKSLKSIYFDENGINLIKSKHTLELENDSTYNLNNNFDFKKVNWKGLLIDSVNKDLHIRQLDTSQVYYSYFLESEMKYINNDIYYIKSNYSFEYNIKFYNNINSSVLLELNNNVDVIKINDSLFYLKYIENYGSNPLKVYEIKDNEIIEKETFNYSYPDEKIINLFNNDIIFLTHYNFDNKSYLFDFEISEYKDGELNTKKYEMNLDSNVYEVFNNYGTVRIIRLTNFNYRVIFSNHSFNVHNFIFNTESLSNNRLESMLTENPNKLINIKKANKSYYYIYEETPNLNCRINIYNYFDNNLVHSILVPQNVSVNYPKPEYLKYNNLKDVTIFDNKLFVTLENIEDKGNSSIVDRYLYNSYILMDTILFDLSEDLTSINSEAKANPDILIFPNPSSDKISVDLGSEAFADLVVYDILGNEIMSIPNYTNKSELDISNLSIGTYTIQIKTNTGSISQRLLVNR